MKNIFNIALILLLTHMVSLGQVCNGSEATIAMSNGIRESENQFSFDIMIRNSGSTELEFSAYGGGILGLPSGVEGKLEVINQPADFNLNLHNLKPDFSKNVGREKATIMRWAHNPTQQIGLKLERSHIKVARLRFTRTGGQELPKTLNLKWQISSVTPAQVVTYCNGHRDPVTLTFANGGLKTGDLTIFENTVSSTKDNDNSFITVTPNPTTEFINVDVSTLLSNDGDIEFQIVDVNGAIMIARGLDKTKTVHSISLGELSAAPYFVKISQNGAVYTKSVIKVN
jgi:hypothetical protein